MLRLFISEFAICWLGLWLFVATAAAGPFNDLVVFGDSLSDVGNIAQATAPYSLFSTPGPYYYQGRFSNGPVYVETLAVGLGLEPITRSTASGNNFAYGGAKTSGTSFPENLFVRDVDDQITQFLNTRDVDADALFVVFAGANDLLQSNNVSTPVNNLAADIQRLITAGARQFLVPNLPLLGNTPRFNRDQIVAGQKNTLTASFNTTLETMLDGLENNNPDLVIHHFDLAGLFGEALADPPSFGLTNVTDPAAPGLEPGDSLYDTSQFVDEPDEYLFWDELHPTAAVHAILAERMLSMFVLLGDYNGNNVVDAADYSVWRDALATGTVLPNDPTPGVVDRSDFFYWRDHFGESLVGGAGSGSGAIAGLPGSAHVDVPEPTALMLSFAGLAMLMRLRFVARRAR